MHAYLLSAPCPAPGSAIADIEVLRLPTPVLAQSMLARAYDQAYMRYVVVSGAELSVVPVALLLCWWKQVSPATYPVEKMTRKQVDASVWTLIEAHATRLRPRGGPSDASRPATHGVRT